MVRVVMTGGGTGGHFYPALAVLETLWKDADVDDILYIGNKGKIESNVVPNLGIKFESMEFSGLPRKPTPKLLVWFAQLAGCYVHSRKLMEQFEPDVVFATGGYITAPVLIAARSLNIPYVIHEPDAFPGLVNRKMAFGATAVTCAFEEATRILKNKNITVTGNPLRNRIGQVNKAEARESLMLHFVEDKPVLLITGGSQGAQKINQATMEALPMLLNESAFQVIHQTGDKLYEQYREACPKQWLHHPGYAVFPFIADMASALTLADIAVCRAGSMTLSEMYRAEVPTILVPYPHAAADHQRKNAMASEQAGASIMIEDQALTGHSLCEVLRTVLSTPDKLKQMKATSHRLAHPYATEEVIRIIKKYAKVKAVAV